MFVSQQHHIVLRVAPWNSLFTTSKRTDAVLIMRTDGMQSLDTQLNVMLLSDLCSQPAAPTAGLLDLRP